MMEGGDAEEEKARGGEMETSQARHNRVGKESSIEQARLKRKGADTYIAWEETQG